MRLHLVVYVLAFCGFVSGDSSEDGINTGGWLPVWTYADDSGCLETHSNYLALWITMKGTSIDAGQPSSNITHGKTCMEQGYTKQTNSLKDLPAIVRGVYAGVTSWSKPSVDMLAVRFDTEGNKVDSVNSAGLLPVWTYADDSGCLETHSNYLALWFTAKGTSIDTGHPSSKIRHGKTCAEQGYTKQTDSLKDLPAIIRAVYAGVTSWSKQFGDVVRFAAESNEVESVGSTGLLPVWTYADDSGCLQTHTNYMALWITMKGTGIDTGHPSSNIMHGKTCAEQGYTKQTDTLKDLPAIVRAAYYGVTSWSKPSSVAIFAKIDTEGSKLNSNGLLPVWTYADDSGCLETHTNYLALWITMKGTSIDAGHPSSMIKRGMTCAEQGYSNQTDVLKDLPAIVRAAYAGVTSWSKEPNMSIPSLIV